ncbi:hypothetical protein MBLNU459_g2299t1 [Dothideomycetes sp. NU459]
MADEPLSEHATNRKRARCSSSGTLSDGRPGKRQNLSLPGVQESQPVLNRSPFPLREQISALAGGPTSHTQGLAVASANGIYVPPFGQNVPYPASPQLSRKSKSSVALAQKACPPITKVPVDNRPCVPAFGGMSFPQPLVAYRDVSRAAPGLLRFVDKLLPPGPQRTAGSLEPFDSPTPTIRHSSDFGNDHRHLRTNTALAVITSRGGPPSGGPLGTVPSKAIGRIRDRCIYKSVPPAIPWPRSWSKGSPQSRSTPQNQHIVVVVGSGAQRSRYEISKSALCQASATFRRWLSGNGTAARDGMMRLERDPALCWDVFAVWLEDRQILEPPRHNPTEEPLALGALVRLYQMATEHRIQDFKRALIRPILRRLALERHGLSLAVKENIRMIYNRIGKGDVLRDLVVDWLIHCVPKNNANMLTIIKDLPTDCVFDVVSRLWVDTETHDGNGWIDKMQNSRML